MPGAGGSAAAGLIHGDLKAANVMREEGGRILLMDFGAARRHGGNPQSGDRQVDFGSRRDADGLRS